ncbi:MAG: GNAT family N-acetyltransferase [Leptolyngbya sp. SIOISBB]|nr:GNAT family N-acetyltransferase [Leptolyngbya sp. SIOISBB]
MQLQPIDPHDASPLIEELDAYQSVLYPDESNHLDSIDVLRADNVHMLGAYDDDELAGIGAIKLFQEYGEIKRVFVPPAHRGKGYAKSLMAGLEQVAAAHGLAVVRLETGIHQQQAIGLYRKLGYAECDAFGDYVADPLSVFMQKALRPNKALQRTPLRDAAEL